MRQSRAIKQLGNPTGCNALKVPSVQRCNFWNGEAHCMWKKACNRLEGPCTLGQGLISILELRPPCQSQRPVNVENAEAVGSLLHRCAVRGGAFFNLLPNFKGQTQIDLSFARSHLQRQLNIWTNELDLFRLPCPLCPNSMPSPSHKREHGTANGDLHVTPFQFCLWVGILYCFTTPRVCLFQG